MGLPPARLPFPYRFYPAYAALAVMMAMAYVALEHPAYVWDWSRPWDELRALGEKAAKEPVAAFGHVLQSIAQQDYNVLSVLPLLPAHWLLGGERSVYVAALCAIYVVPAALVASLLATGDDERGDRAGLAIAAALLFPGFWNAALRGMTDVAGLIPLGLAALLMWNTRFLSRGSIRQAVLFGALLWLTFALRRWYAFSVVALIAVSLAFAAVEMLLQQRRGSWTEIRPAAARALGRWLAAGAGFLAPLLVFQLPLVLRILGTDYAEDYSAYQRPAVDHLAGYYHEFGPLIPIVLAIGLWSDWRRGCWRSTFFLLTGVTAAVLFARVQAPGPHHYLPMALLAFPGFFSGLAFLQGKLPQGLRLLVPALLLLNFANAFLPARAGAIAPFRDLLQESRYPPLRLENYSEYQRLTGDLAKLGPDARIAVFASSVLGLSGSLLAELDDRLTPALARVSHVDLRDGFFWSALNAEYALIGRPTPLHLDPAGQRVISLPAEDIGSGTGLGTFYRSTGRTYRLDEGIVAELYQRTRPIPPSAIEDLAERFYGFYPQWRGTDRRAELVLATATVKLGARGGRAASLEDRTLMLRPGEAGPTRLLIPPSKWIGATSIRASIPEGAARRCPGADGVVVTAGNHGSATEQRVTPGVPAAFPVTNPLWPVELAVGPYGSPDCDVVKIEFQD